jgi:Ca2+-binding EF-hand superfamily protein
LISTAANSTVVEDIDSDGNGTIEFKEFIDMMTGKMCENDSREDIVKVFAMFDADSTNKVSFRNRQFRCSRRRIRCSTGFHWV